MKLRFSGRISAFLSLTALLMVMALLTACAGIPTGSGTTGGGITKDNTGTQTTPGTTPLPGSEKIEFIGTVKSVNASSLEVTLAGNDPLQMSITTLTDRKDIVGGLPTVGQWLKVKAVANPDGTFTASELDPADVEDQLKQSIVDFEGIATSAVGTDNVLKVKVGSKNLSFTLAPTTKLDNDFLNSPQNIKANQPVKVKVQYNGTTANVLEVDNALD